MFIVRMASNIISSPDLPEEAPVETPEEEAPKRERASSEVELVLAKLRQISDYVEAPEEVGESPAPLRRPGAQVCVDEEGAKLDVSQLCAELQCQVIAMVQERIHMASQLKDEQQKFAEVAARWEDSQAHIRALQLEIDTMQAKTEQSHAAHKEELATSSRKSDMLSQRLVDLSTKLEEPAVSTMYAGPPRKSLTQMDSAFLAGSPPSVNDSISTGADDATAMEGAKAAAVQIESARRNVGSFKARWDAMRKEADDAKVRIGALEEHQDQLQKEIARQRVDERKRRGSLHEIRQKLKDAETSWNPWKEIDECKQQLDGMKDHVGTSDDTLLGA